MKLDVSSSTGIVVMVVCNSIGNTIVPQISKASCNHANKIDKMEVMLMFGWIDTMRPMSVELCLSGYWHNCQPALIKIFLCYTRASKSQLKVAIERWLLQVYNELGYVLISSIPSLCNLLRSGYHGD